MTSDMINGLFEFIGGCLIWLSVRKVYRDKRVAGVSLFPISFFTSWGFWNLYYYLSIGQWFSFWGGCLVVTANCIWLFGLWYYSDAQRLRRDVRAKADAMFLPRGRDRA